MGWQIQDDVCAFANLEDRISPRSTREGGSAYREPACKTQDNVCAFRQHEATALFAEGGS